MPGLTLDKKIEKINETLMGLADEHLNKHYIQNLPKNSKELKKIRRLSYKLNHESTNLLKIKNRNEIIPFPLFSYIFNFST